jgi:hypothetical protein
MMGLWDSQVYHNFIFVWLINLQSKPAAQCLHSANKHTCVCATCGQGFTRKSSAARHNYNLHSGQAIIVKPYDYIVGRLNGEFSPGDPAAYRRDRRGLTNPFVNNVRPNAGIHTDMHTLRPSPSNTIILWVFREDQCTLTLGILTGLRIKIRMFLTFQIESQNVIRS